MASNYGLPSINSGLLWDIVGCCYCFGLLGCPSIRQNQQRDLLFISGWWCVHTTSLLGIANDPKPKADRPPVSFRKPRFDTAASTWTPILCRIMAFWSHYFTYLWGLQASIILPNPMAPIKSLRFDQAAIEVGLVLVRAGLQEQCGGAEETQATGDGQGRDVGTAALHVMDHAWMTL